MCRPRGDQISRYKRLYILGLGVGLLVVILHSPQVLSQNTQEWVATLKSVEGTVEARRAAQNEWLPAALNDTFTIGDSIRVLAYSRAAILLPDETVLRLDQNTTVTFTEPQDETRSWLELLKGAIHIISRDPGALKVITPFAGAGLEGTEFLIEVTQDETIVTVYEGEVSVSTDSGDVNVTPGQRVTARTGQQPIAQVVVRPRDAVQWTLYYAPILDYEVPAADEEEQAENPLYYTGRASARLAVGRVDEARADIAQALNIDPTNVDALALQSIIAVAQNDFDSAFALANRALALDSDSAAAMIALSYAQQAILDISGALLTMQGAVERHPLNGFGWARLSELWLAVGDLDKSLNAALTAVDLNSNVARAQTVLGFAFLAQIDIPKAMEAFNKAIVLDQAAPLPRLGLGLAMIRAGDLEGGRAEIEIAVILDPGNALIRSYMGKAYYEEKRDDLAASQLDIAKQLDPLDPTPWFYDAIRKQTINRPIEALDDLQESIARNNNRAVFRSKLMLDEDLAARSASLGRIYRDLGFEQLALVEGTKSLDFDPANHSAHRFLADSYSAMPRHEIARASELLQAQLLQPININAVQPSLVETDLNILSGAGPGDAAFNEFTPLFERNRHQFVASGFVGNNKTRGDELALSGVVNGQSYSVGQFHYESDGFRENNDLEHDIYNLFYQVVVTDKVDIQFEYRQRDTEQGDLRLNFDPDDFSPFERRNIEEKSARVGIHYAASPQSDLITSLIYSDGGEEIEDFNAGIAIESDVQDRGYDFQTQYIFNTDRFNLISGFGVSEIDVDTRISTDFTGVFGVPCPIFIGICDFFPDRSIEQHNAYVYSNLAWTTDMTWTLGLSYDSVEQGPQETDEYSPKVGLRWNVADNVELRLVYLETVKRALIIDQTLEPTQVAGFNQFFDDVDGSHTERYGVGIDAEFANGLYGGLEVSRRNLGVPTINVVTEETTFEDEHEDLYRIYLYWPLDTHWAVSAEIQFERFKREDTIVAFGVPPTQVETTTLPFTVQHFMPTGHFFKFGVTYVRQEVDLPPLSTFDQDSDDYFLVDAIIGHRFAKRRGLMSLEVRNLFDEEFLYQDVDIQRQEPSNPRYIPERTVLARITWNF